MSGSRPIWNDGQGITTPDNQRVADTLSGMDDRAMEVVCTPPNANTGKSIIPLTEDNSNIYTGTGNNNARLLAYPGTTLGQVSVFPATFVSGGAFSPQILLSGTSYNTLSTGLIASNASGSTRYDLVYATLTRAVTITGSRKMKSVIDGSISAQTVNLADAPTVTLQVIQNVSGTTPLASLPADTASAYYFGLTMVTVANGYTSGSSISSGISAGGTTFLSQLWSGGWIQPSRYRSLRVGSLAAKANGTTGKATMPITDRFSASYRMVVPVKITGTNQIVTLDDVINWSSRMLGIRAYRAGALTNTAVVGLEYPASFPNGINGVSFYIPTWFAVSTATVSDTTAQGGNGYWTFSLGAGSSLVATYNTQALASGTGVSDQWWFDIDYTDRMIF